jgi:predicted GNAT superfamily acetyltransferase
VVPSQIKLRELTTESDYAACVGLQRATWGAGFTEVVPPSLLMISQKVGGIAAGAFDVRGRMLGFVWGMTGIRRRQPVHWSHMLAVAADQHGRGIGQLLKQYQRSLLLKQGVGLMHWTFDPLVSRNAHLNLNRLGVRIDSYVPDYYGADTDSELHSGLGTDRFIVAWHLRERRVSRALSGNPVASYRRFARSAVVGSALRADGQPDPTIQPLPDAPSVLVECPVDIHAIKRVDPSRAWQWRQVTRRAFLHYLGAGYRVEGIFRNRDETRAFYALARAGRTRRTRRAGRT